MSSIKTIRVVPYLPEGLEPLLKIARNMWWVWNFEAIELFRRIDVDLWKQVEQNPLKLIGSASQKTLNEVAESESFRAHMQRVEEQLDSHLEKKSWFEKEKNEPGMSIAYFSAEFGIHESLPIYSGGLGVLAGDHLKSSSEMGIPLCGVGLLYKYGYFRQYLNLDGWQQERFPETDFSNIPGRIVAGPDGAPLLVSVEFPGSTVFAQIWEISVGRVSLFLLDTNISHNSPEDRAITDHLYGGDNETRVRQEIMLGIGGTRALKAMNKDITVYHMNEGHAAFLALERIRMMMEEKKMSFSEASEFVTASNVFTTHTPVPAGNDRFPASLILKYFRDYYGRLGIGEKQFLGLGRENPENSEELFCMTVLAIKCASGVNGVSKLHGKVSREMWKNLWPSLPEHEIPIGHITNGIQTLSWTSDEMMRLLNRYIGPRWIGNPADNTVWKSIDAVPDAELWRCRERSRERFVAFTRKRLRQQLIARGFPSKDAEKAKSVLDPEVLTIGFARRFATYKRAALLFRDIEKFKKIAFDKERPVQFIFAGKAHPKDNLGKELIKEIIHRTDEEKLTAKIVFIEDYDINIARMMVQGVDVWLNTPVRPKEASGTSGMKVIPNGGLNVSVLDGWWDEAYNSNNGWAIGNGEVYNDIEYQDDVESVSLYNIIENELKPLFYTRTEDNIPEGWLQKIRESIKSNSPVYNTNRMVADYTELFYIEAHKNNASLSADSFKKLQEYSTWKNGIFSMWKDVAVRDFRVKDENTIKVGQRVHVSAEINLGSLKSGDVEVELYFGSFKNEFIHEGAALSMDYVSTDEKGVSFYEGQMLCLKSGDFGFTVRVRPFNVSMPRKFDPEFKISWA